MMLSRGRKTKRQYHSAAPCLTQIYQPSHHKREVHEVVWFWFLFMDMTACTIRRLTASHSKMKVSKKPFNLEIKHSFPIVPSVQD